VKAPALATVSAVFQLAPASSGTILIEEENREACAVYKAAHADLLHYLLLLTGKIAIIPKKLRRAIKAKER